MSVLFIRSITFIRDESHTYMTGNFRQDETFNAARRHPYSLTSLNVWYQVHMNSPVIHALARTSFRQNTSRCCTEETEGHWPPVYLKSSFVSHETMVKNHVATSCFHVIKVMRAGSARSSFAPGKEYYIFKETLSVIACITWKWIYELCKLICLLIADWNDFFSIKSGFLTLIGVLESRYDSNIRALLYKLRAKLTLIDSKNRWNFWKAKQRHLVFFGILYSYFLEQRWNCCTCIPALYFTHSTCLRPPPPLSPSPSSPFLTPSTLSSPV